MPNSSDLQYGNYRYFPVLPGRLEFAYAVRRALLDARPKVVAVELPELLESAYLKAIDRLPELSVILYDESEEEAVYVPVEPADAFVEAVRTAVEISAEVMFIEPELNVKPHLDDHTPDSYSLRFIGYEKYVEVYRESVRDRKPRIEAHAEGMAYRLQGADPSASVFAVVSLNTVDAVIRAMKIPQEPPPATQRRRGAHLINPHPECLTEILTEYAYLQQWYETRRLGGECPDRARVQMEVLRHAEGTYETNTGDRVVHWHRRLLAKYTRNLAQTVGELSARAFDLALAARSIVDDNYGWEVWASANRYMWQSAESDLETLNLTGEEVWINTRKLRLRRRLPRFKQRLRPSSLKPRKKEKYPGEWAEQVGGNSICSYPPEDLVIENYGRLLKQKAKSILSEERERTEAFTTSLLDGIDIRETIRNWHERKIYVRKQDKITGDVGSVVVIFDEDRDDRYGYLTTWLGEHQNESDMAFYSTYPFEHIVGPGIGRAEYGGFLMTLPPRRMYDVWTDPDYDLAETKAERLLLAAIDYSIGRMVVYAAKKPPRSSFRSIAAKYGQKILYVPLGQLSPTKLKQIRVVHVLDSHQRRNEAKEYLW